MHRFGRRDGVRIGGGGRAELVNAEGSPSAGSTAQRRQSLRIDAAYRAWAKNRRDVEKLRELQDAISDVLAESFAE